MADGKEYNMLFKLSAQLGQNFNGTFSSAQKTLAATQKEIQSLNKLQSDISSYVKQQQSVDALKNKLSVYQQQLQNIQTELKASGEDFCIGGACYPEVHTESANQKEDIKYLKEKIK